jgi:hypothetical protein
MRPIIPTAALAAALALTACGTRGNLTQLPGPHQPPVLERWAGSKPAPAPATRPADIPAETQNAGDNNTAPEAAK